MSVKSKTRISRRLRILTTWRVNFPMYDLVIHPSTFYVVSYHTEQYYHESSSQLMSLGIKAIGSPFPA